MMLEMSFEGCVRVYWEEGHSKEQEGVCTKKWQQEKTGNVCRRTKSLVQLKHRIWSEEGIWARWTRAMGKKLFVPV